MLRGYEGLKELSCGHQDLISLSLPTDIIAHLHRTMSLAICSLADIVLYPV